MAPTRLYPWLEAAALRALEMQSQVQSEVDRWLQIVQCKHFDSGLVMLELSDSRHKIRAFLSRACAEDAATKMDWEWSDLRSTFVQSIVGDLRTTARPFRREPELILSVTDIKVYGAGGSLEQGSPGSLSETSVSIFQRMSTMTAAERLSICPELPYARQCDAELRENSGGLLGRGGCNWRWVDFVMHSTEPPILISYNEAVTSQSAGGRRPAITPGCASESASEASQHITPLIVQRSSANLVVTSGHRGSVMATAVPAVEEASPISKHNSVSSPALLLSQVTSHQAAGSLALPQHAPLEVDSNDSAARSSCAADASTQPIETSSAGEGSYARKELPSGTVEHSLGDSSRSSNKPRRTGGYSRSASTPPNASPTPSEGPSVLPQGQIVAAAGVGSAATPASTCFPDDSGYAADTSNDLTGRGGSQSAHERLPGRSVGADTIAHVEASQDSEHPAAPQGSCGAATPHRLGNNSSEFTASGIGPCASHSGSASGSFNLKKRRRPSESLIEA